MILVVGATGDLGGRITRRLLAEGRRVRVLVRARSDHESFGEAGAEPIPGDLKDTRSLEPAVAGVEMVITTANSSKRGGDDNAETVDRRGNADLVAAAQAAGVKRFIFISAIGCSEDSPVPFLAAKAATERRIRESGMRFTILAPLPYMDTWLPLVAIQPALEGREVVYAGTGENRHSMVATDDVAEFVVAGLEHPAMLDAYFPVGGPRPFSWREAVAAVEHATGRPVSQRGVPVGQPVPGVPDHLQPLLALLGSTEMQVDSSGLATTLGVRQTTVDDWIHAAIRAAHTTSTAGSSNGRGAA
jgi:uncharacterized protein YbjT (DUF2867 family)